MSSAMVLAELEVPPLLLLEELLYVVSGISTEMVVASFTVPP